MALAAIVPFTGCAEILSTLGDDPNGASRGITYYLGGAGTLGSIGNLSVKEGLRKGGYRGAIDVVPWQSWFGDVLRDQIDRGRNQREAERVAQRITEYSRSHPGKPINIIALSAGTGIATWAMERLPDDVRIASAVFLGSSLSRQYDLAEALRRLDGRLYVFYSPEDPILRYGLPLAGTVDREFDGPSAAGLRGFALPPTTDRAVVALYNQRLRNIAWRPKYARYGYNGRHTDGTSKGFVANIIVPLLNEPLDRPQAVPASAPTPPEPKEKSPDRHG